MKNGWKYLIPNGITLLRIPLSLLFLLHLGSRSISGQSNPDMGLLTFLFAAICLSDFMDGRIARSLKATSIFGTWLDVLADFLFIIGSTAILVKFNLLPVWYPVLILFKLAEFIFSSRILNLFKYERKKVLIFDSIGKATANLFYIMPYIVLLVHTYLKNQASQAILVLLCLIAAMAMVSIVQRLQMCIRAVRRVQLEYPNV